MSVPLVPWCKKHLQTFASPPVVSLLNELGLVDDSNFPSAARLNALLEAFPASWCGPLFKAQGDFDKTESRYYEEIIAKDNRVPTREHSWHDLFNALIWVQFPATKALLNQLHMTDIAQYGAHPRTARRNRLTHFDECGVVLAMEAGDETKSNRLLAHLAQHQWVESFIINRPEWNTHITPIVFGHANLEMMLAPFIGLTGKWLAVSVPQGFAAMPFWQQRSVLDTAIVERIKALSAFSESPLLKPIPLLGVPGWYEYQDEFFYSNTDYFRSLRQGAKPTIQLPFHDNILG